MSRRKKTVKGPQPWYRPSRGLWYCTVNGHQHKLGPGPEDHVPDELLRKYHELLAEPPEAPRPEPANTGCLVGILDRFLAWCQEHRKPATYEWYRWRLQLFAQHVGPKLVAPALKHYHLDEFLARYPSWSKGMKRSAARAVQRAMRWAKKKGYTDTNPVTDYEKPAPGKRDLVIAPEDFEGILALCPSPNFRDLLEASWETGCRPQESLAVEARHVDLEIGRWHFPADESKGEQWPRIVYLTPKALDITKRLMDRHRTGRLFRNDHGRPWTPYAVNCAFCRLQMRMGLQRMNELGVAVEPVERFNRRRYQDSAREETARTEHRLRLRERAQRLAELARQHARKYCLYNFRHSWLDRALKAGVDVLTCAVLMGHRDPSTISRTYQHLSQSPEYLRSAANKAVG
jgi:integrase